MAMQKLGVILTLGCILHLTTVSGLWSCSTDTDCSSLSGGVCLSGDCVCEVGKQAVFGGTLCVDVPIHYMSPCYEDHQCFRLSFYYECRRDNGTANNEAGYCACQEGAYYFRGRCWSMADFGDPCARDEECMSAVRDPLSMVCDGTCVCAPGRYLRQRDCRTSSTGVGDSCIINEDCQFQNGVCDLSTLTCYDSSSDSKSAKVPEPRKANLENETSKIVKPSEIVKTSELAKASDFVKTSELAKESEIFKTSELAVSSKIAETSKIVESSEKMTSRQTRLECSVNTDCPEQLECASFGVCLCPVGYYSNDDGSQCLAELGSPSTVEQCAGLFAVVVDGICSCPVHYFFDENLRDCVRPTRRLTDSCLSDAACHTFGPAARCQDPQPPWGQRRCECLPEITVWDERRQMCRFFAGIGESCEVDSDCLAGELEIQCVKDAEGHGSCACPEGLTAVDGLCITTGLGLGDACQVSQECTAAANSVCEGGVCACDSDGYGEVDGVCAPLIGGECTDNADCVVENTVCVNSTVGFTCQCGEDYVEFNEACWPRLPDASSSCTISAQCHPLLGADSLCSEGQCVCSPGHHLRDGGCWRQIGLFEPCSRTSVCFLSERSERVVCRNSLCQCRFQFPYDEELRTCSSSASYIEGSILLLTVTFSYMFI